MIKLIKIFELRTLSNASWYSQIIVSLMHVFGKLCW